MVSLVKFHNYVAARYHGEIDFSSHTFKVMLTNVAPTASSGVDTGDITEIAAGNGYTAGGNTLTISSEGQVGGTYKVVFADSTFTAAGGPMAEFRYAVVYDATTDRLIGYYDNGSAVNLPAGISFIVDFDPTNGFIQAT